MSDEADLAVTGSLLALVVLLMLYVLLKSKGKGPRDFLLDEIRAASPSFNAEKEIANSFGHWSIMIDEKSQVVVFAFISHTRREWRAYKFGDLIKSEVTEDGNLTTSTVRSSQIVGAVVGNALIGGVGLLVGGLTGKTRSRNEISKVTIAITVNDTLRPLWVLPLLNEKKPVPRSGKRAQAVLAAANHAHALLSVLIRQADDLEKRRVTERLNAVRASPPTQLKNNQDRASFAEEFMKLAKLKEKGVLSESEFAEMKASLIAQAKK